MSTKDFTTILTVDQTPEEVFNAVKDVKAWWTPNLKGKSSHLNDEFEVRFGDVHYSKQKLIEVIPNEKVVWLVLENYFKFTKEENEWTGNRIIFEITEQD